MEEKTKEEIEKKSNAEKMKEYVAKLDALNAEYGVELVATIGLRVKPIPAVPADPQNEINEYTK